MSSHCFLEGANIHHYAFVEGAIILPCQLLGGGGGGGECPAPSLFAHIRFADRESFVRGGPVHL